VAICYNFLADESVLVGQGARFFPVNWFFSAKGSSMNMSTFRKAIWLGFIVLIAGLLTTAVLVRGAAQVDSPVPVTEPGAVPAPDLPPSYDSGSPLKNSNAIPPDENAPQSSQSPALVFSYYQVAGATLRGRNSSTGYFYDGAGCSHVTAGSGNTGRILNTELPLPDGSVIKYLRVYYRDTNAASGVDGYITRYQPGTGTVDLVKTGSTNSFVGGYGFVVSGEITETVNNTAYAYTLIGWPGEINLNNQICGLRVAYYAPAAASRVFMPSVRR
jgi:hypothetical protein